VHGFFASLSMTEEERGVRRHRHSQVGRSKGCGVGSWVNRWGRIPCDSRKGANGHGVLRFAQNDRVKETGGWRGSAGLVRSTRGLKPRTARSL
jgi:hypothetical protein